MSKKIKLLVVVVFMMLACAIGFAACNKTPLVEFKL